MSFDIVIPLGTKDINTFRKNIEYTKRNIIDYRNIYVVTPDISAILDISGCIPISETIYPFNKESITKCINTSITSRTGWYFQQLLKLYSGMCIPGILSNYLIIDSDVFFVKPTAFLNKDGRTLLCVGTEYHMPYFDHMKRLHPSLYRTNASLSGIAHHMMFNTNRLRELFKMVEEYHGNSSVFWELFMKCVDPSQYINSGASEYEIYFNYMILYHSSEIEIRQFNWTNDPEDLRNYNNRDFIVHHDYALNMH